MTMIRAGQEIWHRLAPPWVAAAAPLLAISVWAFVPLAGATASPAVFEAMPPGEIQALIVEAHDEWTGDPPVVRPARRLASTSVAIRNHNPLNIKYGGATQKYVEQGIASISRLLPRDGGHFLKFQSAAAGFRAAVELLTSPLYTSLDLNSALQRWSHNGYGAEIVAATSIDPAGSVTALEGTRLAQLLRAMAAAEGYRSPTLTEEIAHGLASVVPVAQVTGRRGSEEEER